MKQKTSGAAAAEPTSKAAPTKAKAVTAPEKGTVKAGTAPAVRKAARPMAEPEGRQLRAPVGEPR